MMLELRYITYIEIRKTYNPFLWLWWLALWCRHKIRGEEVYLSKPSVLSINDNGDLTFTSADIGDGIIDVEKSSPDDIPKIAEMINNSPNWIGSKVQSWDE